MPDPFKIVGDRQKEAQRLFDPFASQNSEVASELRKLREEIATLSETLGACSKSFLVIGQEAMKEFRRLNGP